jgi:hypothetical protein
MINLIRNASPLIKSIILYRVKAILKPHKTMESILYYLIIHKVVKTHDEFAGN